MAQMDTRRYHPSSFRGSSCLGDRGGDPSGYFRQLRRDHSEEDRLEPLLGERLVGSASYTLLPGYSLRPPGLESTEVMEGHHHPCRTVRGL